MADTKKIDLEELRKEIESGRPAKEIMKEFGIKTSADLKNLYYKALTGDLVLFKRQDYTIFISAALFTYAEQEFNRQLRDALEIIGFNVILPQEFEGDDDEQELFRQCVDGVEEADLVVAVVDGAEVDAGVGFEMGVAYSQEIPIIALRTDFRRKAETTDGCLNLMLQYGATKIISNSDQPFQEIVSAVQEFCEKMEEQGY